MAQVFSTYLDAGKPDRFIPALAAYWRDTPVTDVTAGAIRQSALQLYPHATGATRNRQVIAPTQAAINVCAEMEWCAPIRVRRFPVETKPKRFATPEWVDAFQDHASPHMGALCRFMFETGARIGEATALCWQDIDLAKRQATIHSPKNGHGRIARLTPNVLAALANIPSDRDPGAPVFTYASRESVRQVWDHVIERAGIERLSPHSCRHGFATAMLRSGVDAKTVARWGGWKDIRILLGTYAHAIDDPTVVDAVFDTRLTQCPTVEPLTNSKQRRKTP